MARHCIIGEDYEKECEARHCRMRNLCKREHDIIAKAKKMEEKKFL